MQPWPVQESARAIRSTKTLHHGPQEAPLSSHRAEVVSGKHTAGTVSPADGALHHGILPQVQQGPGWTTADVPVVTPCVPARTGSLRIGHHRCRGWFPRRGMNLGRAHPRAGVLSFHGTRPPWVTQLRAPAYEKPFPYMVNGHVSFSGSGTPSPNACYRDADSLGPDCDGSILCPEIRVLGSGTPGPAQTCKTVSRPTDGRPLGHSHVVEKYCHGQVTDGDGDRWIDRKMTGMIQR